MMQEDRLQSEIVAALLKDRRADRLWRNIRFLIWLSLVLIGTYFFTATQHHSNPDGAKRGDYVALVRLDGEIMDDKPFSAMHAVPAIRKAFADRNSKGVLLLINSPGGSATQASIIHDQIVSLKKQYHKRLIVVGVDTLASGAYLVACAADKIYVNRDTVTGSIGVIFPGFGLVDAIQKLGITRRVFTSGANKDELDPFKPLTPETEQKIQSIVTLVHQNFILDVKAGRGKRLKGDPAELFSGAFWTGQTAVELGLVDGTGDFWSVMKNEFHVSRARDYTEGELWMDVFLKTIGTSLSVALQSHTSIKAQAV